MSKLSTFSWFIVLVLPVALILAIGVGPVGAIGAVSNGMAGAEVALTAEGIPLNPAATGTITRSAVFLGYGAPPNSGLPSYISIQQPADADTPLSGVLGAAITRTPVVLAGGGMSVIQTESIDYQMAESFRSAYVGVGVRWIRQADESTGIKGEAWRLDLGWQQPLAPGLMLGVAARDVLGLPLRFTDGTQQARVPSCRIGLAYSGTSLTIAADAWDFTGFSPQAAAIGLQVAPIPQAQLRAGYRYIKGRSQYSVGVGGGLDNWHIDVGADLGASVTGTISLAVMF